MSFAGTSPSIETAIRVIRGQRVMLDFDLAEIYGVPTKRLIQQFKRNAGRFPKDFAFQLSTEEFASMRSQNATASDNASMRSQIVTASGSVGKRNTRFRPHAFTEHGAIMLASVLNSAVAVAASVEVVRAFVKLRQTFADHLSLATKLSEIDRRLEGHDDDLTRLFDALRQLLLPPAASTSPEIGFHVREDASIYSHSSTLTLPF